MMLANSHFATAFAQPALAVFAMGLAVALPFLIHLLSRRRRQVVPWAATRFLLTAQKRRRRRIDERLLMVVRIFTLLLPLLAMCAVAPWAESLWQAWTPGALETRTTAPRTHHVLVIDGSMSLSARGTETTRHEDALQAAQEAVRQAGTGDLFTVIHLEASGARQVVPGPSADTAKVKSEVAALQVSHGAIDLSAGLHAAAEALSRTPKNCKRRRVMLFTDLQRSSWNGLTLRADGAIPDLWNRILPKAEVAIVDVARKESDNLAVTDLSLADPLAIVDAPCLLNVTLRNFGRTDRKKVRLELRLARPDSSGAESAPVPVEQRFVDLLPAGNQWSTSFSLEGISRPRDPGVHVVQVKVGEGDDLPADDTRSLAFQVRKGLTVLVVDGHPAREPLQSASGYLARALMPRASGAAGKVRAIVRTPTEFADPTLGDLSEVDAVYLADFPDPTPAQVARLEAFLKRGGGVVIGLGPRVASAIEEANRRLYADGNGLLPGPILALRETAPDDPGFRLVAEEESYRKAPLAAFRDDDARAGLTSTPFRKYLRLDAPPDGRARRIASFVVENARPETTSGKLDPAILEWSRHRGRVVVMTSSFDGSWTDWPLLPSYLPFVHETLRFAVASRDRRTIKVGERIEEFLPVDRIGLTARLQLEGETAVESTVEASEETGIVTFPESRLSGVAHLKLPGVGDRPFAVQPSDAGGSAESDLRRIDPAELKLLGPLRVVDSVGEANLPVGDEVSVVTSPAPHGPKLARTGMMIALALLLLEVWLAWKIGPSARGGFEGESGSRSRILTFLAWIPLIATIGLLAVVLSTEMTPRMLERLPDSARQSLERNLGVPSASVGETTLWRLETTPVFGKSRDQERRTLFGIALVGAIITSIFYFRERRAAGSRRSLVTPLFLRLGVFWLALLLLLPQIRLAFEREGWPDVAILIDTSASMATVDDYAEPELKTKTEELAKLLDGKPIDRLRAAKLLLLHDDGGILKRLITERRVRVHIHSVAERAEPVAECAEPSEEESARAAIEKLEATGESSRLGDAVTEILKSYRGGSLEAILLFTDGITTSGEELARVARDAGRADTPLSLIGIGAAREPYDLLLADLRASDMVLKGDTLVFEARLTARGASNSRAKAVPVILSERIGDKLIERARLVAKLDPSGKPVAVRLETTPTEPGERNFVLEVPPEPNESETTNNRIERTVSVADSKELKVLYVEGYARYEYRFVKSILERETETVKGNKSIRLSALLLDATREYAEQDKSAIREFPTRSELFGYDAVILGDVVPEQLPRSHQTFQDLADFVKVRGGGLLFIAGTQANPTRYYGTPLAELLPVAPASDRNLDVPLTNLTEEQDGFRWRPTPLGKAHPLFRMTSDPEADARALQSLKPLLWHASRYKRKATAEVLATHPTKPAEDASGELHPLVLQQFSGAGRTIFFGFDETWRWRSGGEEKFNRFWIQTVRHLARSRIPRPEIRTDRQTNYRTGEPIRVTVRFPDDAAPPPDGTPIVVEVEHLPPRGEKGNGVADVQSLRLSKVEGTRATYESLHTRTPPGEYIFTLVRPESTEFKPRTEVRVVPPPGERERLDLNRAELLRAAGESKGKYYSLADASQVVNDLPEVARVPLDQPHPPIPLWNQEAIFLLIFTLLAFEWLLRRRHRLL